MAWTVEVSRTAERQIARLDRQDQTRIVHYLKERVEAAENPRLLGKALHGERKGLWRYRVGEFRLICEIRDEESRIVVLEAGHRKEIYR